MKKMVFALIVAVFFQQFMAFSAAPEESSENSPVNLMKGYFDKASNGQPKYFKIKVTNSKVEYDDKVYFGEKGPSVKLVGTGGGESFLEFDQIRNFSLKEKTKYLFSVQIKVVSLKTLKPWYKKGLYSCFYTMLFVGRNNKWSAINGSGNTDGWVTMLMPFDTGKDSGRRHPRFLFRMIRSEGTVYLQNPSLIELPADTNLKQEFLLKDNNIYPSKIMELK